MPLGYGQKQCKLVTPKKSHNNQTLIYVLANHEQYKEILIYRLGIILQAHRLLKLILQRIYLRKGSG